MRKSNFKNILFASASPIDKEQPRSGKEFELLNRCLKEHDSSGTYNLQPLFELNTRNLFEAVGKYQPEIVHFSTHGTWDGNMVMEKEGDRTTNHTPSNLLGDFFGHNKKVIDCVFLNYCYSIEQAQEISKYINYVVAMSSKISSDIAIYYSYFFYSKYLLERDFITSFSYAQTYIKMEDQAKNHIPMLYLNGKVLKEEELNKLVRITFDAQREREHFFTVKEQLKKEILEKEKDIEAAFPSSPHGVFLIFLWDKRYALSLKAARLTLKSNEWFTEDHHCLKLEIAHIIKIIHQAVLDDSKQSLASFAIRGDYQEIHYHNCLDNVTNAILHYEKVFNLPPKSVATYIDYITFLQKEMVTQEVI